jgi:hypothetical protein
MRIPPSPHFAVVPLDATFNARRDGLPEPLRAPPNVADWHGERTILGIPFAFGGHHGNDVIQLDANPVVIELGGARATYVLFVHAVEDVVTNYAPGFANDSADGRELGRLVSEYELEYEDGTKTRTPILRRFAIQQSRIISGASPTATVPAGEPLILRLPSEEEELGRASRAILVRHLSARDAVLHTPSGELLWIYALPNPAPERPLRRVTCAPRDERSAIYAVTLTALVEHPLRPGTRRKLRLTVPSGVELNALGELDEIGLDLGTLISARAVLNYDHDRWAGADAIVEPTRSENEVIVEYAAHPAAKLYVGLADGSLVAHELPPASAGGIVEIAPATRPVKLRIVDRETGTRVAVRLHLHGEAGEYLPPRGHHRKVNRFWFQDNHAEFVNVENQYSYVDGECLVDLPLGTVYAEVVRGYEIAPLRTSVEVAADTDEITFELDRVLRWREQGWVTADTHVHFLSPQTALLEGRAEGVNVVNLLASQWGEMFSNVGDFDGRTTFGAKDFGGDGEFLVRVGSENRMQVLGHISLLGYTGELIHPLCTGGPGESALGDPLEVTMAEWAQRCLDQRGLVVLPHAPDPQLERAADIVLGLVDAIEMMTFNPLNPVYPHVSPYGLADWYRYLSLGYHVPLVGGSDKMAAGSLLGGIRTYVHLGERELTYENWMEAVRAGNTFVTVGPLASLRVEGVSPGGQVELPPGGGSVAVEWKIESVALPIERVEVVVGGLVADDVTVGGALEAAGNAAVPVAESTWIALRVRGSYRGRPEDVAAHTSAVQVLVESSELFSSADATTVLDQIEGAIAYVDTLAPPPDAKRLRQLRATLETAYNRLHQRMHAASVYHRHSTLHDHEHPHEH